MTSLLFNEQNTFSSHQFPDATIPESLCVRPGRFSLDSLSGTFYHSCIPDQNALGPYGICGPGSDSAVDPFFSTSSLHQLFHSKSGDSVDWQQPVPHYLSFREEDATPGSGVGENLIPCSDFVITLPERQPAQSLTTRSLTRHVSASSSLPRSAPGPVRYTPYRINRRQYILPASVYQCQWFDGVTSCGAHITGTKSAIGKHLLDAHAVCLKADKTFQACLWEGCHKFMRRESISRHILAVHMRDKVLCPTCGSRFARTDSLQRHQRTQCLDEEKASHASLAEG